MSEPMPASGAPPRAAAQPQTSGRNRWLYGFGTLGRDMAYTLVSFFLIFYLTDVLDVDNWTLAWITGLLLAVRLIDAVLDPIFGAFVDSTRSRFGQFKPWMALGGLISGVFTILLFTDLGLTGSQFIIVFTLINLLWGVGWAAHDISYWGMLPALSLNPADRERTGAVAKIFASIGQFTVVAGVPLVAAGIASGVGGDLRAWQLVAVGCSLAMIVTMGITILTVRQPTDIDLEGAHTGLRAMARALFRNDQLLWIALAYLLFMVGYGLPGAFGLYFFKYAYGDESVFSVFVIFVGVGQLVGQVAFPWLARRVGRRRLYTVSTIGIVASFIAFALAPMNVLVLGVIAVIMFFLASIIMLLMLVFQADTIEYGQWRLGQRNGAVTFALQPFMNKVSGATNTAIVGVVAIVSGINEAQSKADVSTAGQLTLRLAMVILPAILVTVGYLIWKRRYIIDEQMYARIVSELDARGDLEADGPSADELLARP
ncbi:MAG: glycoside-pentoside-hexuronide (GPH):cation symporter [Actinomycetia bacterium]|nr:glycoside-pentoside-hexuronide (GPH):cation symporter [Actinomycetes bacterium]